MERVTITFLILLVILGISVIVIKRERIAVPLVIAMCFFPADISISIYTLDFYALRIFAILGFLRILFSANREKTTYNSIDYLFFAYHLIGAFIYVISSQNTFGATIYKSGALVDSVILYIVLRNSVRTEECIYQLIRTFSVCLIVLLPFCIFEYFTANNLFSILGRESISIRDGEIRAACTFSHPILFGSFAASLFPVQWSYYKATGSTLALFAAVSCIFFSYASSSSAPLVVIVCMILFLSIYHWRNYYPQMVWFTFFSLVFIHFVRTQPIWHLLYIRIPVKQSSAGYHRYLLIDAAYKEVKNWWLSGYGDVGPQWHLDYWPWTHANFTDLTNHYILLGVRGGLISILLFLILCFKVVSALARYTVHITSGNQWIWWGLTGMMIAHCLSFLSVSYFGQISMLFYLNIAIGAFCMECMKKSEVMDGENEI